MEIKERIWKQFVETGDPGLYMLYKTLEDNEGVTNDRGEEF